MAHVRTAVRAAFKAALLNTTDAGDRVYASRSAPIPAGSKNALRIWCKDEPDIRVGGVGAGPAKLLLDRTLEVVFDILVRGVEGSEAAEDAADEILLQVEQIVSANQGAGGVKWAKPRRIETDIDGDGDAEVIQLTLTCEALYFTALDAPDVAR